MANHQNSGVNTSSKQKEAILFIGIFLIKKLISKFIIEHGFCFLKSYAMFLRIDPGFVIISLKFDIHNRKYKLCTIEKQGKKLNCIFLKINNRCTIPSSFARGAAMSSARLVNNCPIGETPLYLQVPPNVRPFQINSCSTGTPIRNR